MKPTHINNPLHCDCGYSKSPQWAPPLIPFHTHPPRPPCNPPQPPPPPQGKKLVFVTNNSTKSRAGYLGKFTSLGLNINAVG
jgi:hypothetical protein